MKQETTCFAEFPRNPNLLNLHFRKELTTLAAESYRSSEKQDYSHFMQGLFCHPGLTYFQVLRHHIRLRKTKEADWQEITPCIKSHLTVEDIIVKFTKLSSHDAKKTFEMKQVLPERIVLESPQEAEDFPLFRRLFALHGITQIVAEKNNVTIKKAYAFSWKELEEPIQTLLRQG